MTNEKLNNDNWQARLEDADALQEYALQNKPAAWESLYNKLHKNQQPKTFWYWIAAACLITIIAGVSFIHNAADKTAAIHTAIKTQPQQNTVAQQPAQQSSIKKEDTTHEVAKTKIINTNNNQPIKHIADKNEIVITDSAVFQPNELTNIKTELPIIKDSAIQIESTVAVAPKKMKIVHVNELDDDGSNINMVQNHIPSRIKFLNQDIYTDYTLTAPASGFSILKHKNYTSN